MSERRKPGPSPGPKKEKVTILLPAALRDWGKEQPGGLSGLVQMLLEAEQKRRAR